MSTGAITLNRHILDIPAASIHQRVPLVIGSAADISLFEAFLRGDRP